MVINHLHPLKLTVRPWKWMVGIRFFPFGMADCQRQTVSFREGTNWDDPPSSGSYHISLIASNAKWVRYVLCVYTHPHKSICIYIYYIHMYIFFVYFTYIYIYLYLHIFTYIYIYIFLCMYIFTYIYILHVFKFTYMYIHIYLFTFKYIHTHTHVKHMRYLPIHSAYLFWTSSAISSKKKTSIYACQSTWVLEWDQLDKAIIAEVEYHGQRIAIVGWNPLKSIFAPQTMFFSESSNKKSMKL